MERLSMPKLIAVLVLLCFYVFSFIVMNIAGDDDDYYTYENAQNTSYTAQTTTTTQGTTISLESWWKPSAFDYTASTTASFVEPSIDDENAVSITDRKSTRLNSSHL